MHCKCLPFTQIPHTSRLFGDFLYHFDRVRDFYAQPPLQRDWLPSQAQLIPDDPQRRARVADVLARQNRSWGASAETLANIERMRSGAYAVVTGQQVGLFGGPAYSLFKALSAVKVSLEFTRAGVPAVPVFWLATEDHDFNEVATAVLPAEPSTLAHISVPSESAPESPVGNVPLGRGIEAAVRDARELLGDSEAADLLAACYTPDTTWGSAFARLFCRAFARLGLVVVDPSDPELHAVAAPVLTAAVERAEELSRAVLERGKALEAAGYHQQVKVTAASTFLFRVSEGRRVPVRRANGGFMAGQEKFTAADLAARARSAPEEFSASALLRPVVQDYLLSSIAGVGGPAEVAYYAQSRPLYERLLGRTTPILPRFSATLVEPRVARLLDRYGIDLVDLLRAERPAELLAARALPQDLEQRFATAVDALNHAMAGVSSSLNELDHTLVDAANRAGAKMRYQIERLHGRAARAHLRRSEVIANHALQLTTALYPDRDLQERVIGGVYWLARYGFELLPTLLDAVRLDCPDHQVVRL